MADEDKSSKTEQATPQKRRDAKKRGQVAKSQDVGIALGILAAFGTLIAMKSFYFEELTRSVTFFLGEEGSISPLADPDNVDIGQLLLFTLRQIAVLSLPVLAAVLIITTLGQLAQVGFIFTGEQLKPKFEKINPVKGMKRWFAIKSLVELGKSLAKIAITFFIGYLVWKDALGAINESVLLEPADLLFLGGTLIAKLFWNVLILYVSIAVIDLLFQRWQHSRDLRMSKKELKDEYKRTEGDPYMKARRRQVHQQISQQQAVDNVPHADAIVINPTELAIAIKYDPAVSPAPYVLAKGERRLADEIRASAKRAGVPVVRNKPLARGLFETCEIGDIIPVDLYKPVAEILTYVFAMKETRSPAPVSELSTATNALPGDLNHG